MQCAWSPVSSNVLFDFPVRMTSFSIPFGHPRLPYTFWCLWERRQKQSVFSVSRVLCRKRFTTNERSKRYTLTQLAYWRIKESYQIIWRKLPKEGRKELYGKEDEEEQKQIRNTARDILWDKIERGEPLSRGDSRCTSSAGVKPNLVSAALFLSSYSLSLC